MTRCEWKLNADGSFDLAAGAVSLRGGYPSMDGAAVRAMRVQVSSGEIRYELAEGAALTLRFGSTGDVATLDAELTGMKRLPWRIAPLEARVEGAEQLYCLGLGFSGPSGWLNLSPRGPLVSQESYLLTALRGGAMTLAVGALTHHDYLQKTMVSNRQSRRGLTNRHVDIAEMRAEVAFYTENTSANGTVKLPTLTFRAGADSFAALSSLSRDIARAMNCRTHMPSRYHWCSWYEKGCNFSFDDLISTLDGLEKMPNPPALQAIQIDDGYCPSPGDWLTPNRLWPGGMEKAFGEIRQRGYAAGVWVAPFMVGSLSRCFAEHPDWIIRDHAGKPIIEWKRYDASGIPAHIDPEHYALDASHPGVQEYIRGIFRTLRRWGATFYKTDFMDWGLRDTASVKRYNPDETSVQSFRKILSIIREEIGDDSYWLACISPYAPFFGFADGMRIANDVGPHWGDGSHGNMINESIATQPFNNVFWQNDPDAILLRNYHNDLSDVEVRSLALFQGFLGSVVNFSDAPHKLPEDRLELMHFLRPPTKVGTASVPFFGENRPVRYLTQRITGGTAMLAMNPTAQKVIDVVPVSAIADRPSSTVYDWTRMRPESMQERSEVVVRLEPHEAKLLFFSDDGKPPKGGMTITGRLA